MDAKAKTVQEILSPVNQFLVPFFQRHYAWKVQHWNRFWDDLRGLSGATEGRQHFLGPLVCTKMTGIPGDVPVSLLIDGQQRLTTLSILLCALRDTALERNLPVLAQEITEQYLINRFKKGESRFKVVPRSGDREVLFGLINGTPGDFTRRDGIVRAHKFFKDGISQFAQGGDLEDRLRRLFVAATARMSLVVVGIDEENAYEIFDSLNSTGLQLAEADLIRNHVFMKVPFGEQTDFNTQHWQPFESMFDEVEEYPAAVDPTLFYRDYLMRDGNYVRKNETFTAFKTMMDARQLDPGALVKELRKYASYELLLRRPGSCPSAAVARTLRRLDLLKITTAHPLVMNLLARRDAGGLTPEDLLGCLHDLESFVIRRTVCGESTRGYSQDFPAAINAIKQAPRGDLRAYWMSRGWPDDGTFKERLVTFPLYRRERLKCQLILEALEESFGHKEQPDITKLNIQIEHVMPQTIDDGKHGRAWKEMLGEDWETEHEAWLDTLGNLTLTGYNPSLSNRSFEYKKGKLEESNFQLNKAIVKLERWDAKAITARGKALAEVVAQIWDRPAGGRYVPVDGRAQESTLDEEVIAQPVPVQEYWTEFLQVLGRADGTLQPKTVASKPRLVFPTGRSGSNYIVAVDEEEYAVSVEVCFTGKYRQSNVGVLKSERAAIERELGCQTDWEYDGPCRIAVWLDAAHVADRADWARQHKWLSEMLVGFRAVLGPRLRTDGEGATFKKIAASFWKTAEASLSEALSGLAYDFPKKPHCEIPLGQGVSLWLHVDPEENWLGAGLGFDEGDREGQRFYEAAQGRLDEFASSVSGWAELEDEGAAGYLSAYAFAKLSDETRWEGYHRWLVGAVGQARRIYAKISGEVAAPAAAQATGA